jgi:hypothetical protein
VRPGWLKTDDQSVAVNAVAPGTATAAAPATAVAALSCPPRPCRPRRPCPTTAPSSSRPVPPWSA